MKIKQEIYNHLAKYAGVYLPAEVLDAVVANAKTSSIFSLLSGLEHDKSLKQYDNPAMGAYVVEFEFGDAKIVKQVDVKTGEVIKVHKSLQEAAESIGKGTGNISNAIKYGRKAYGYYWK